MNARYAHTNLVARDWKRLARFYRETFGCQPVPPERELAGRRLEEATGIPGVQIRGIHLLLPGHGEGGPTLEIFQYQPEMEPPETAANRPGLSHIAFSVEDVPAARDAVLAAGGGTVGEIVSLPVPPAGTVTFVYATDPEGNIVELQSWAPGPE